MEGDCMGEEIKLAYCLRMVRTEEGKRIRKAYENHQIECGFNEFREAEPRTDGLCNTITTVLKDNLFLEVVKMDEIKVIGQMDNSIDHTHEDANRVYDENGISPTIQTYNGGNRQPKIMDVEVLGGMGEKKSNGGTQYYQQNRVYNTEKISPALNSSGEELAPKIVHISQASNEPVPCKIGGWRT